MLEIFVSITVLLLILSGYLAYRWARASTEVALLQEKNNSLEQALEKGAGDLQALKSEMKVTFESLAAETLKGSNQELVKLAKLQLGHQQSTASADLDAKKSEITNIVDPLKKTLSQFFEQVSAMEIERQRSYALVEKELKRVVENNLELSKETRALKEALKRPHVRGRWGEMQLKNCVELAGMSEHTDITFQDYNQVDSKILIPDMSVRMPGGRTVVVDAKTPIDAFLASLEATSDEQRNAEMIRHGKQVKNHIREMAKKSYGEALEGSADFTVMFLPNESFLYAALETQPDLVEFAMERKILVATPPTFVGLLKVIRYGWNEDKLTRNAEQISEIGRELHKRIADFVEAYSGVGKALHDAQEKYDLGMKRLKSRVLVQTKKMEDFGG